MEMCRRQRYGRPSIREAPVAVLESSDQPNASFPRWFPVWYVKCQIGSLQSQMLVYHRVESYHDTAALHSCLSQLTEWYTIYLVPPCLWPIGASSWSILRMLLQEVEMPHETWLRDVASRLLNSVILHVTRE